MEPVWNQLTPGLSTPPFEVELTCERVARFADCLRWPLAAGVPPTLPATFWQKRYPDWLKRLDAPQLLKRQSFFYARPLRIGAAYECRIELTRIERVTTPGGKTYAALVHLLTGRQWRELHFSAETLLYVPVAAGESGGSGMSQTAGAGNFDGSFLSKTLTDVFSLPITPNLIRRYADVSGDDQPIHVDESAARNAGYPGLLAHGLLGMGLAARVVLPLVESGRVIRSYHMEFRSPLFAGDTLSVLTAGEGERWRLAGVAQASGKRVFHGEIGLGKETG